MSYSSILLAEQGQEGLSSQKKILEKIISKILVIAFVCCILHYPLYGQIDTVVLSKKATARAVVETVGINAGVWAFNRYMMREDFAKINFKTIGNNFSHGFVWDNDMFSTNLLGHPYHGGLYFNAARSNGMNFWQSAPYTVTGSFMWEFFMENEYPSINDFISTPIGGIALGEITFRLSGLLIDSNTVGWNRFGREFLATLISPMSGLNRILTGEAWKIGNCRSDVYSDIPVYFYAGTGHRALAEDSEIKNKIDNAVFLELQLLYGNLFSEDNEQPYDAFHVNVSFNFFSEQPIIGNVNIIGQLWGESCSSRNMKSTLHWGIFQHFDYYDSNTIFERQKVNSYRIAEAAALGVGGQYTTKSKRGTYFSMSGYLNGILLGGSITDYYRVVNRDYNLGSGFSSKLNIGLGFKNSMSLRLKFEDYRLFTWKGYSPDMDLSQLAENELLNLNIQGDEGWTKLTVLNMKFDYRLKNHYVFSLETSYYSRYSFYKHFPNVKYQIVENKIGIGYLF
jgi:hypothetical protein